MGVVVSTQGFRITVKTGRSKFAGTDNQVKCILYDEDNTKTDAILLDNLLHDDFGMGRTDIFTITHTGSLLTSVKVIELWREGYADDDWLVENIIIENRYTDSKHYFPINRWIPRFQSIVINEYDSTLPQYDTHVNQRKQELDQMKNMYRLDQKKEGLIPQVKDPPQYEMFAVEYSESLQKKKRKMYLKTRLNKLTTRKWKTLADIEHLFGFVGFNTPRGLVVDDWKSDLEFGELRLSGFSPVHITLCTKIPENFPVTSLMLDPFLEGSSLHEMLEKKKLFLINHEILEGCPCTFPDRKIPVPMCLLYLNKSDNLLPIAIQLYQQPAKDNPVFLPSDPLYTWTAAKMWFNVAESNIHEALTHLGFTHLIMESIAVCTNRQLSKSHPIHRLLAPHFLHLIAINSSALKKLVCPGGWVDRSTALGRKGFFHLIAKRFQTWRMDTDGILKNDLKNRQVDDRSVLPYYPYADFGLMLYNTIQTYVTTIVEQIYDDDEKLLEDYEIQAWAKELSHPADQQGCGIQGVPGGGSFHCVRDLIDVITCVIFTCSAGHSSANFQQYDIYSFTPFHPILLHGEPPKDKSELQESDIMHFLPNLDVTLDIILITSILSERGTKALGHFEVQHAMDPMSLEALEQFQDNLEADELEMRRINQGRRYHYETLYPSEVPNAISI